MNKLQLFNRISDIETHFVKTASDFYDHCAETSREVLDLKVKAIGSVVTVLIRNSKEDTAEFKEIAKTIYDIGKIENLDTYSRYNPFVWLRITCRRLKEVNDEIYSRKQQFRDLLKEVDAIKEQLQSKRLKERERERLKSFLRIRDEIKSLLEYKPLDDSSELMEPLILAFSSDWKMKKNDFFSLITVNRDLRYYDGHENDNMKYMDELPDEIDYETFRNAVFVYKLEHNQDCCFFDIFMDDFLKQLGKNKDLSEKIFDKFQEIFGPVPTYSVSTNEEGEIISLTPNKPKLKVVKG